MSSFSPKPLIKRSSKKRKFTEKEKSKVKEYLLKRTVLECICAFLLARTTLIGGTSPLGLAFFAANFPINASYPCALALILGLVFSGKGLLYIGKYIIALTLFALIWERFLPEKNKNARISAVMASLCLLSSGTFLLFADITFGGYPLMYDSMVLIVECATLWLFTRAFNVALGLFSSLLVRRRLTAEEAVSVALFSGGIICGLGGLKLGFFSLSGVLCVFFVLLFALRFGSLEGCAAGIIMGVVYCLSQGRITVGAASFALSGLCAGYFSKYGRWSVCLSFIITNAAVTILSNGSTEVLINLMDAVVAAFLLYCIPKKVFSALGGFSSSSPPAIKLVANKLHSAENTIQKCEKSFRHMFELRNDEEYNTLLLYRRTARKTCGNCGLRKYCWGRDAKATKDSMDILCKMLGEGKNPPPESAPNHCLRKEQFVCEFSRMFEIYKNDCMWTEKIGQLRGNTYSTFSAVSGILGLCRDNILKEGECDSIAADNLRTKLKKEGILTREVFVTGKDDDMEITISLENCGGFGRCENAVCKVLEDSVGKSFVRTGARNCGECCASYVVKPSFSVTTAVASAVKAKKKISGDHATFTLIDRHTYAMILCDGMGSGEIAREESKTCSNLLLSLLSHKVEVETAINIINSMLLWTFSGSVAAIDLCLINLDDGSSKIYKCGGVGSYAKIKNSVSSISTPTLPLGSFSSSDVEVFSVDSEKGSMLVMVSDGVVSSDRGHNWIAEIIDKYEGCEPHELSQMILSHAKSSSDSLPNDDLTVMAAYIG